MQTLKRRMWPHNLIHAALPFFHWAGQISVHSPRQPRMENSYPVEWMQNFARLLFVSMLICPAPLQATTPSNPTQEYLIDVWETDQGLPEDSATSMVQTPDGYLWFGTFNGLVRFDGVKFTVFDPTNTPDLPNSRIINLHLDRSGRLWISTERAMACVKDGKWTVYKEGSGWIGDYVHHFAESASGELYVATFNNKILRFRGDGFEELPPPPLADPKLGFVPYVDEAGALWVVNPLFIGKLVNAKWQEMISAPALINGDPSPKAQLIGGGTSRDGSLWVVTAQHLRKYRGGHLVFESRAPWPIGAFWSLHEDSTGTVWISSWNSGLYRLTPDGQWRHFTTQNGLSYYSMRFVFEDRETNLWVGTSGGGLMRFKRRTVTSWGVEQGLPDRIVRTVTADQRGRIFMGTNGQGVAVLDGANISAWPPNQAKKISPLVQSVLADRKGRVWVGTSDALFLVDETAPQNGVADRGPVRAAKGAFASLFEDSRGRIWVDGEAGEFFFDGTQLQKVLLEGAAEGIGIGAFAEDPGGGTLWGGGDDNRIYRLEEDRFVPVREAQELSNDLITALFADPDGTLWVATAQRGIACLRNGRLTRISQNQGLPARAIGSILDDGMGNLWLGSSRGILRAARKELEALINGQKSEISVQVVNRSDGMASQRCSIGLSPTAVKDRDGKLWFATLKGVVAVDPGNFRPNNLPPSLAIDEMLIDGQPANVRAKFITSAPAPQIPVTVPPGAHRVEIHYAALSFTAPEKVRFRYILEGLDKEWIDAGTRRVVYLQDVKPGKYRLRVKAANDAGVWNETGTLAELYFKPHFYQAYWFFGVCVLGVLLSGAGLHGFRTRRLRARATELLRIVDERTKELQSEIVEHKRTQQERERLISELQEALSKVKQLSGFLPMCASCKKIRDDRGYWEQIEVYIRDHSEAEFSHGLCPECARKLYPEFHKG